MGLMIGASGSGAEAFVGSGLIKAPFGVTPAAMCGYSCRNGGRYIPGPPSVCEEEGLSYCGSSRGGASPRREIEEDEQVVPSRRRIRPARLRFFRPQKRASRGIHLRDGAGQLRDTSFAAW